MSSSRFASGEEGVDGSEGGAKSPSLRLRGDRKGEFSSKRFCGELSEAERRLASICGVFTRAAANRADSDVIGVLATSMKESNMPRGRDVCGVGPTWRPKMEWWRRADVGES